MTITDPHYSSDISIRTFVTQIAARFTPAADVQERIVERCLRILMDKPEIDLTDPLREIFPVVRQVAVESFALSGDKTTSESEG